MLGSEKYDAIYNRVRYLISLKKSTEYIFSDYLANIKVYSYDSLPIEKIMTLHSVIVHIKSFQIEIKITTTTRFFQESALIN